MGCKLKSPSAKFDRLDSESLAYPPPTTRVTLSSCGCKPIASILVQLQLPPPDDSPLTVIPVSEGEIVARSDGVFSRLSRDCVQVI